MVLDLLAVCAVADISAVEPTDGHDRSHCQGNALVGGSEENVEIQAVVVMDGAGIVLAQLDQLGAGLIGACVHKEGRLSSAL